MKITIKPPFRNAGYSLGLQYPVIYGDMPGVGWCCWNRHTGVVEFIPELSSRWNMERACAEYTENQPGFDNSNFSPFEYDSVS